MSDVWLDLEGELEGELDCSDFNELNQVLDYIAQDDFGKDFDMYGYDVTYSFEKINRLQRNVCVNISKESFELELLFEDGINNGTQLNGYSINPTTSFTQEKRTVDIVTDIKLDLSAIKDYEQRTGSKVNKINAKKILGYHRKTIREILRKQSYDNYVTGGNCKINKHDSEILKSIEERGVFWTPVYGAIEVDNSWV